jgi:hypothetical protein
MLTALSDLLEGLAVAGALALIGTTIHLLVSTLGEARSQAIEDDPARRAELVCRASARRAASWR